MRSEEFESRVRARIEKCLETLGVKAAEYVSTEDRLRAFKAAAALEKTTPESALGGMLAKHIVSIYDMLSNPDRHSMARWDEKIGDAINYLLLLDALLHDNKESINEEN